MRGRTGPRFWLPTRIGDEIQSDRWLRFGVPDPRFGPVQAMIRVWLLMRM